MTSSHDSERMLKLMAYADGELSGAERDEVEGWLASDVDAMRFAHEVANLGDLVKTGFEASPAGKARATFDVADLVMAKVAADSSSKADTTSKPTATSVIRLDAERGRRQRNMKMGGAALAALALAASVFMVTRAEEQPMARGPVPLIVQPTPAPNGSTGPGVDVDLEETPGHSVSVFYLPSENTLTTSVVVWVDETGEKK